MKVLTGLAGIVLGGVCALVFGFVFVDVIDPVRGPPEGVTGLRQLIEGSMAAIVAIPVGAVGGWKIAQLLSRRDRKAALIAFILMVLALFAVAFFFTRERG